MDSNEKNSIHKVIENINKFIDSNSSGQKKKKSYNNKHKKEKNDKKHSANNLQKANNNNNNKEKKSSKKIESKRLKDLFSEENVIGGYMHTEGNNVDIHDIKNKILRNNNFKSKQFKERRRLLNYLFLIY